MNVSILKSVVQKQIAKCSNCHKDNKAGLTFSIEAGLMSKVASADGHYCYDCIEMKQQEGVILAQVLPLLIHQLQSGIVLN